MKRDEIRETYVNLSAEKNKLRTEIYHLEYAKDILKDVEHLFNEVGLVLNAKKLKIKEVNDKITELQKTCKHPHARKEYYDVVCPDCGDTW
jgi:hypothetical protein